MSEKLNETLLKAYNHYKNDVNNSPLPLETIKEYLALEGIEVE